MSINKVIIQGNLTKDPEISYLPSQTAVCQFGLAHTHKYESSGQKHEDILYITCKLFGKRAEVIQKFFVKGKPIIVEGRLKLETWDGPDGKKNYKHVVMVDEFHFLPSGEKKQDQQPAQQQQTYQQPSQDDDTIPF